MGFSVGGAVCFRDARALDNNTFVWEFGDRNEDGLIPTGGGGGGGGGGGNVIEESPDGRLASLEKTSKDMC